MASEQVTDYKTVEETRTVHYCDACGKQVNEDELEYCAYDAHVLLSCGSPSNPSTKSISFNEKIDIRQKVAWIELTADDVKELCPTCSGQKALVKKERGIKKRSYRQALAQKVFTWGQVGMVVMGCTFIMGSSLFVLSGIMESTEILLFSIVVLIISWGLMVWYDV